MKTEKLIQNLALTAEPVKPINPPIRTFFLWLLLSTACIALAIAVTGPRMDWAALPLRPQAFLPLGALMLLVCTAAFAALCFSVPGERGPRTVWLLFAILSLGLSLFLNTIFFQQSLTIGSGWKCARNVFFLSLIPSSILYLLLKSAAPLWRRRVGALCALASAALACLGTRFICPNDGPLHFLAWHCGPVLAATGLGVLAHWLWYRQSNNFSARDDQRN